MDIKIMPEIIDFWILISKIRFYHTKNMFSRPASNNSVTAARKKDI